MAVNVHFLHGIGLDTPQPPRNAQMFACFLAFTPNYKAHQQNKWRDSQTDRVLTSTILAAQPRW